MKKKSKEPKGLLHGKEFHEKIQAEWKKSAEGEVKKEEPTTKPSGRQGRMDIFVVSDQGLVAIAEIKNSNWDAMTLAALQRNVRRQAEQVWDYIEAQLEKGKDVSPGVIFPKRPKDPDRLKLIEQLFEEQGISVVWEDESIEERKARSLQSKH
jgi:hypothetical protein